jgi:fatty acid amide hydrolase
MKTRIHDKLFFAETNDLQFNQEQLLITKASAVAIGDRLLDRSLAHTLPELFRMFHFQKQVLNKTNPALCDVFYHEPYSRALSLNAELSSDPHFRQKYPLFGFVISVKDIILYKNSDCTHGLVININRPSKKSAVLIQELELRGALVSAKGNVPQAVFSMETENNIFGIVTNPYDNTRIAGGSTGGDSVLIATGSVNACIGTDQGGSLRIPALFCGICSFKPTEGRFSDEGSTGSFEFADCFGKTGDVSDLIPQTIGPMANWVQDLKSIMRVMAEINGSYFNHTKVEWKDQVLPKRVGIIRGFPELLELCQTSDRALTEAAEHLRQLGTDVVPIDLSDLIRTIVVTTMAILFKGKQLRKLISGDIKIQEPLVSAFHEIRKLLKVPFKLVKALRNTSFLSEREKIFIDAFILSKEYNNSYLRIQRRDIIYEVIKRFKDNGVETAIAPGLFPAVKVRSTKDNSLMSFYVFMWNFLNFPCGALPITRVEENEEVYESRFNDKIAKSLKENIIGSKGLPVGIQIVGIPFKDELVLEVMQNIEGKAKFNKQFELF